MATLTEKQALNRSRASCLVNVKNLNCWGSDLNDISLVRQMINLEVLNLSVNSVTSLKDLSFCPRLKELYLRKNQIKNLEEIKYLKNLACLKVLWLSDNPCSDSETYRDTILRNLPRLTKLDSTEVSSNEVDLAIKSGDVFDQDIDLPNYEGMDLNHTLTFDTVRKYTSVANRKENVHDEKPDTSQTEEKIIQNVTKSVDIDLANKRRAELGLKELDLSCSTDTKNMNGFVDKEPLTATEPHSNKEMTRKSAKLSNSNIMNAVMLLLNDLNTDELHKVALTVNTLLEGNDEEVAVETQSSMENVLTD